MPGSQWLVSQKIPYQAAKQLQLDSERRIAEVSRGVSEWLGVKPGVRNPFPESVRTKQDSGSEVCGQCFTRGKHRAKDALEEVAIEVGPGSFGRNGKGL